MQQLTVRVPDETAEAIDERANDSDSSQSEAVRELLRLGFDHERLQAEADDLRRQLQAVNRRESDHQELVAFASERRSMLEADRRLRNLRRAAPIWRKVWWSIFGEPIDPETGERT
jgi:Arc/MetJ-type ribon-helix-helix transcriptional regulator